MKLTMISKLSQNKSKSMLYQTNPPSPLHVITFLFIILLQFHYSQTYQQPQSEHQPRPPNGSQLSGCRGSWQRVGNKCIKIVFRPTNYELAKAKCGDIAGSHMAIIDDSSNERESTSYPANITHFLSQNVSESQNRGLLSKQFYVNISANLMEQYKESIEMGESESETTMSDLWFSPHESEFANITGNFSDPRDYTAFALVYSKRHSRWGIIPVNPTRKFSILCENPLPSANSVQIDHSMRESNHRQRNPAHDNLNPEPTIPKESLSRTSNQNIPSTSPETRRPFESSSPITTNPQPQDVSSLLFREVPQDRTVVFGTIVELRCSSIEPDTTTISWSYNGKEMTNSTNRIKLLPRGTLKIEQARYSDKGNYTCKISSGVLTESKTIKLEIVSKPYQPESITAELLDKQTASVRIKWIPGFDGNSPIIKYAVEMKTVNSDSYEENSGSMPADSNWELARVNISADESSVIINDLKPARKYIFRIKATNRIGTSEPSKATKQPIEVPVQPPSMAPTNFVGVAKTSTSISLQWSPPPVEGQNGIIKGYVIQHRLAGYIHETQWYSTSVPENVHQPYILDDLIVWQTYEIAIAAKNEKDVGPFSHSIIVKTKEGAPDKSPREVTGQALSSSSIRVEWFPPPPEHINGINQGYRVQAWLDLNQTQIAKELVVGHNSTNSKHGTSIDGLVPYTDYYISVKCYTVGGDGPPNEEIVKIRTEQDIPEAVASLEFYEVLDKSLRLLWRPPIRVNGELDHYTLEYSEGISTLDQAKKVTRTYPPTVNEAIITDLNPQTSYIFKIYPHTIVGAGLAKTNQTTTSIPPVLPEPPTSLTYSNIGPNYVTIQFKPGFDGNAAIDRWIVDALVSPQMRDVYHKPHQRWQVVYVSTNHSSKAHSIIVRNLKPFTRYKIRLTPQNVVGQSKFPSEPTDIFETAQTEPEKPPRDLLLDDIMSTSVNARWLPLQPDQWQGNPVGYNLSWVETHNPNMFGHHLINDSKADSYTVKNLEEFTEYAFTISAINEAGSSPQSEPVHVTTLEDVPAAGPTNLTAHAMAYAISLDWNAVPKRHRNGILKGYKIQYQALRENAPLQVKTVEDNTTRHVTLTDLKAFTTYHLAVAAYTSAGDGVYTNVLDVKTLEDTPGNPQNLSSPTISQTTARILWDPPVEPNGEILGYRVSYHSIAEGASKEVFSQELHQNERTFKATNLKPENHYLFTVTAKTKEGWGAQANTLIYTYDSELRANLPFYRESWFVILCACSSIVITILITALLFVQTKSYKYKQEAIKQSGSQDRLGDAGFTIDDELATTASHYNNGFGLLSHNTTTANHRRSNGALSQSTANFTLPKSPPRPHPGSVIYSDEGDDDVFEDVIEKNPVVQSRNSINGVGTSSKYCADDDDTSGDSLTEKPSEISSSPAPESESPDDDEYANKSHTFTNHYANVSLRNQKVLRKNQNSKHYAPSRASTSSQSRTTRPKLPQRPVPSVPHVPGSIEINSSGSDNPGCAIQGTTNEQHSTQIGTSRSQMPSDSLYGGPPFYVSVQDQMSGQRLGLDSVDGDNDKKNQQQKINTHSSQLQSEQLLSGQSIVNLNGGRIIVDNMAGSRAPLPGFTSFV